jgi:hypothetical protein
MQHRSRPRMVMLGSTPDKPERRGRRLERQKRNHVEAMETCISSIEPAYYETERSFSKQSAQKIRPIDRVDREFDRTTCQDPAPRPKTYPSDLSFRDQISHSGLSLYSSCLLDGGGTASGAFRGASENAFATNRHVFSQLRSAHRAPENTSCQRPKNKSFFLNELREQQERPSQLR